MAAFGNRVYALPARVSLCAPTPACVSSRCVLSPLLQVEIEPEDPPIAAFKPPPLPPCYM